MTDLWYISPGREATNRNVIISAESKYGRGYYQCPLCFPGCKIHSGQVDAHERDVVHQARVREFQAKRSEHLKKSVIVLRMKEEMKQYVMPNRFKITFATYVMDSSEDMKELGSVMEKQWEWVKEQEPIVLLEVALWKTACLTNAPEGSPGSMVTYLSRGGWKKAKKENRHDPMIAAVVPNVIPFLGIQVKNFPLFD